MYKKTTFALAVAMTLGIVSPSFAQDWSAANKEAVALYKKGDINGAIAKAGEATAAYAREEKFSSATYLKLLKLRLDLLSLVDNPEGDLAALNEGLKTITKHEGAKSDKLIALYQNIYYTYERMGDKNSATKALLNLMEFGENAFGEKSESMALLMIQIATMVKPYEGKEAAMNMLLIARGSMKDDFPEDNSARVEVELQIAKSLMVDGDIKAAEKAYVAQLAIMEASSGDHKVLHKETLVYLANIYSRTKRKAKLVNSLVKLSPLLNDGERTTAVVNSPPRFTSSTLINAKVGIVKLKFNIDKKGFMKAVKVLEKNGTMKFEKAVLRETKFWRFAPKLESGKPVFSKGYEVEYRFRPLASALDRR